MRGSYILDIKRTPDGEIDEVIVQFKSGKIYSYPWAGVAQDKLKKMVELDASEDGGMTRYLNEHPEIKEEAIPLV